MNPTHLSALWLLCFGPSEAPAEDDEGGASVSLGASTDADADADASTDADASAATDRKAEKAKEKAEEREKPWIKRWTPKKHQLEAGVFGGLFLPSQDHDLYDPISAPQEPLWQVNGDIGVRLGYFPIPFVGLEGEFAAMPSRMRSSTDDFVFVWGGRGHVVVRGPWRVTPFVLGGFGALGVSSPLVLLGNDVDPAGHYGGGVQFFATKRLALRLEARHVMAAQAAMEDNTAHHFEVLAGLSFTWAPKPPPPPPPDPDRDKDGFLNEQDVCPDTAGVAPDGCPPKDQDGDGIFDPDDECIDVPGVQEYKGCPIPDTDGDGLLDPDDQCPEEAETDNGFEDEDGCPDELPEVIKDFTGVIEGIQFEFDKAVIRPDSTPTLDKAIEVLKEYDQLRLEISGHTDDKGDRDHNLDLSQRRADAVKKYMVDGGIDESRLNTRGEGPDSPIADNGTEEGRAQNRRTEFKVLKKDE